MSQQQLEGVAVVKGVVALDRPKTYAYRPLTLPDGYPRKDALPITLRTADGSAQLGKQPEDDRIWSYKQRVKNYGQQLAQLVSIDFSIDPAYGVEPVVHQSIYLILLPLLILFSPQVSCISDFFSLAPTKTSYFELIPEMLISWLT